MNDGSLNNRMLPVEDAADIPASLSKIANKTVPGILREGAATFEGRNAVYGDNFLNVGEVMKGFFPDGVHLKSAGDFVKWHIFELMVVKMTRLANGNITHIDSIHDTVVYGAMLEYIMEAKGESCLALVKK